MASQPKRPPGPLEEVITRRFREQIAGRRLRQADIADQVGLSRVQLSKILHGHRPATFTEIVDIADTIGLDLTVELTNAQRELTTDT